MIAKKVKTKSKDKDKTYIKILLGVMALPVIFLTGESLITENAAPLSQVLLLPLFWAIVAISFYSIPKIDAKRCEEHKCCVGQLSK